MYRSAGTVFCGATKMDGASIKQFNPRMIKDKARICMNGELHKVEDIKSFEMLGSEYFAKDSKAAYYMGAGKPQIISRRPTNFKTIGRNHATDGREVFYLWNKIDGTDAASFKENEDGDGFDKKAVYIQGKRQPASKK